MKGPTESPIERIITQDDPQTLVDEAQKLAGRLKADEATKTQVRRLFGTLRQIEMSWPPQTKGPEEIQQRDDAYRELVLFGPRLAYQVDRHKSLGPLAKAIQEGIKHVSKDDRRQLERLVQFFEATVAYYVAGAD